MPMKNAGSILTLFMFHHVIIYAIYAVYCYVRYVFASVAKMLLMHKFCSDLALFFILHIFDYDEHQQSFLLFSRAIQAILEWTSWIAMKSFIYILNPSVDFLNMRRNGNVKNKNKTKIMKMKCTKFEWNECGSKTWIQLVPMNTIKKKLY